MQQYDFTNLRKHVTAEDLQAVIQSTNAAWKKYAVWGIGVFLVVCFIVAIGISLSLSTDRAGALITTAMFFGVVGLVILIAVAAIRRRNRYLAIVGRFARANNATLRFDTVPIGLKGMIFDEGHDRKIVDVVSFNDGLELGNYEYVTGSGKSQRVHSFGYVRVALNKNLPNMVLDAKRSNFLGMTNLPDVYHSSQRLKLEGDFNKYFDLYAPEQYERDALYVFTPDVMQVLIDSGKRYDMEIIDNELFFYQPNRMDLSSEVVLRESLTAVNAIATELRSQTRRYADERVGVADNLQFVAEDGRRLKKSIKWVYVGLIIGLAAAYYTSVFLLPSEFHVVIELILGVMICIFGVIQIVIRLRQ